jgi:enoyl-CoA hydratase/carnithine racemase
MTSVNLTERVRYETDGLIATITFERAEKLNAITRPMHDAFVAAVRRFDADSAAHVLVIRADGPNFCAGRDIAEQAKSDESPTKDVDPTLNQYGVPHTDKPVVTAARGYALGAGGYFFLFGDVRIASRTLRFGLREVPTAVLGPYWFGAVEGIPKALAFRIAMGDDLSVEEVDRASLITEMVDDHDLEAATQRWVERLLSWPSQHVRATKRLAGQVAPFQYTPIMRAAEWNVRSELDALEDTKEAARAFVERRAPRYEGR